MSAVLSTRPIRDGIGNPFLQRVLDVSGIGAGPYLPLQVIAGPEDGAPIDLAALFEALSGDLEAAIGASAPDTPFIPLGTQCVTVTTAVRTLEDLLAAAGSGLAAIPEATRLVYLQPRGDGIRYAHGGTAPGLGAADPGIDLFEGGQYPLRMSDFSSLRLIALASTRLSVEFRG